MLSAQAEALLSGQTHRIANAANLAALLYMELPDINWVGFYFLEQDRLMLGPFQGKPACVDIPVGQGVCGTAVASGQIQRVSNVHEFVGHIACDTDSESELVIPLFINGSVFGVLDIDSPSLDRFSNEDETALASIAEIYTRSIV